MCVASPARPGPGRLTPLPCHCTLSLSLSPSQLLSPCSPPTRPLLPSPRLSSPSAHHVALPSIQTQLYDALTMRTKHAVHSLPAFPVYSSAFIGPDQLILGGGGGQSKTGIKNKLVRSTRLDSEMTFLTRSAATVRGQGRRCY